MKESDFEIEESEYYYECQIIKVTPIKNGVSMEFIATPQKCLKIRRKKDV